MWPGILALAITALLSCENATEPPPNGDGNGGLDSVQLAAQVVGSGFNNPVFLTAAPNDTRLFIVELGGLIRIIDAGATLSTPFLDISGPVRSGGEQGLFSVAVHPDYANNGFFYVNYTRDPDGATVIARYSVSADPNVADLASAKTILTVAQPAGNHNGGLGAFGPDGMLYIGMGDGGGGGDSFDQGQDSTTLLGALLRLDVDGGDPYAAPSDNPFVGRSGADEIWAYGLRNPWRFSFDRATGDIYVADVGQNLFEEVNAVPGSAAGLNYGWPIVEGRNCFGSSSCDMNGLTLPVLEYGHGGGNCSVTGGYVYRGDAIPELRGHYFYSDYCTGFLRSFRFTGSGITDERTWDVGDLGNVTSFGEDASGALYVVSANGNVYRLISES